MSAIFLLPCLISLFFVLRGRIETAFLSVYLPCLLLFPDGYVFRAPHLPAISAAQFALIPIGVVALGRQFQKRSWSPMDALVILFISSIAASELTKELVFNDGVFQTIVTFISIVMAYAVGRQIIEPGMRFATVRRIVILVLCLGPFGLYEWRMGANLFGSIGQRWFGLTGVHADVQYRGSHGRMAVSFNDSEIAGIVFGMTASLNGWLAQLRKWGARGNFGPRLAQLEKYHVPGFLLFVYVLLTQSRGPMAAVAVAYLVLQVPRFPNKKLAMALVGVLIVAACIGAYSYFQKYTNISDTSVIDEQQGSALYRRQMNERYQPLVERGGLLGWSYLSHPTLPGMFSIDNGFLLIHLAYGDAGYYIFLLITAETFRGLIARSWKLKGREDQAFAIALFGAMAVFFISITTAYMGEQTPQIAFLLIGWSQSLKAGAALPSAAVAAEDAALPKFAFRQVFR